MSLVKQGHGAASSASRAGVADESGSLEAGLPNSFVGSFVGRALVDPGGSPRWLGSSRSAHWRSVRGNGPKRASALLYPLRRPRVSRGPVAGSETHSGLPEGTIMPP